VRTDSGPVGYFAMAETGPAAYERYLVPAVFRPLAEATVPAAGSLTGRRVLDVACGTGIVARLASAQGAVVTGVDRHPGMLAVAREHAPEVTWTQADMTVLPLPDGAFDVAFCQQGLQFVSDPGAALRELRRVLVPGGQLAVALWCDLTRSPGFAAYVEALDRRGGTGLGDILRAPFGHSDATRVRHLIESAGFESVHRTTYVVPARFPSVSAFLQQQTAASPLAEPVAALTTADRRDIYHDLTVALADRVDDDGLFFPMESRLFTAVAPP
jgi:SAM-dependent methyltransferase